MAEISLGKVFMTPKGVWDGTKQYQSLDIVMVRGATSSTGYISTDVIPANTPINDKRWKTLFVVNDGEATADFNNKVNKVDANKKAIDTIYAELQKMYGVQISDTEPTEERTGIWVDTSSTETFSVPEIKDNVVNSTDTWSSQKINQMVSVDSYATKSDACADDDRVAIYDSVSKTQKKALFGGGVWNWIVNKLTNAVISNLQTNNQTVLGAINELNSNTSKLALKENVTDIQALISKASSSTYILFHLSGANYTGNDLPIDATYKYGSGIIFYRNSNSCKIVLFPERAKPVWKMANWEKWKDFVNNTVD